MQGFGTDRTLSTREWRALTFVGCGVLVVGVGLGVLIGRMTAAPPDPPPASAAILPESAGLPDSDPTLITIPASAAPPSPVEPSPPLPAAAPPSAAPPPPVVQPALAPPPLEHAAPAIVAAPKPSPPVRSRPAAPKPVAKSAPAQREPHPTGARWVVQLGAFQSSDHANLLVNTLAVHGQAAHVSFVKGAAGQGWFYVQTPPYRSAAAARSAAQALAAREHLSTYLIKLPADAG